MVMRIKKREKEELTYNYIIVYFSSGDSLCFASFIVSVCPTSARASYVLVSSLNGFS